MTTIVTATVVVYFGDSAQSSSPLLQIEIDSRDDGLNGGSTSFFPGVPAYLLVYTGPGVSISSVVASAGQIIQGQQISVSMQETLSFTNTDSATVQKPITSITAHAWLGNNLGSILAQPNGVTIKASSSGLAILRVFYTSTARVYSLHPPQGIGITEDYPILVFVTGTLE